MDTRMGNQQEVSAEVVISALKGNLHLSLALLNIELSDAMKSEYREEFDSIRGALKLATEWRIATAKPLAEV